MDFLTYAKTVLVPFLQARLARSEDGAAMVEYGLLVALIALVCIGALTIAGGAVRDNFTHIANCLTGSTSC